MKRIISCYGGGSRGLATAKFMELMDFDEADLYAGTSIGGIIALALAYGYTAKQIREILENNIPDMFKKKYFFIPFLRARYSDKYLKKLLVFLFDDKPLSYLKKEVFISSHEWHVDRAYFHKRTRRHTIFDAARATSAASTYFKPYKLKDKIFIDAGIYVNNPALYALIYALELWPDENFEIISIGTGRSGGNLKKPPINIFIIDDIIRIGINGSEGLGHRALTTFAKVWPRLSYVHYDFDIPVDMNLDAHSDRDLKILNLAAEKEYERVVDQKLS